MKKVVLIAFAFFAIGTLSAQEVGLRFGGTNGGNGAAIDAVFGTGAGRIHADLAFYNGGIGVDALYDFIHKPLGGEAFSWYAGVGASALIGDFFLLGATAEIGLEYSFNTVPIVIGLDWRPTFWIIEETQFGADGFGLNARWNFGG